MELPDGLLLQVNNGEQWCNRWKHPNEDSDRSTSPSVLRSVARTWKEGLLNRKRPFVGRCCHSCTPQSWERLFNSSIPSLGLRNVIYINETHTRQRGWLARRLSYVLFVMERDIHKDMFTRNVVDNVLNSSRMETAILTVATDLDAAASRPVQEHKSVSKVKQKARAFLQEMVANISPAFIRLTGWVLLRLFNGFFWSIQIHKGQLEMVKKAASENVPMVFLPVHKSHIDYLLITLILFCHNIKAPHIAAGNNLSIPILSTVIRKLGGFFIRRRMEETGDGKKDILYRSLLQAYTEELMRQQQFLEVFLEGTRSRSGKPFPARAGMLSIVVDTLYSGAIGDVLVVPVGISYDRIIEGNYNSEQLGKPKKNESWWGIACGVFRMLRKNYGCVRVDFNQPFSLKEYLDSQRSRHIPPPVSLENALLPIIISAQPDGRLFEGQEEEQMERELPAEIFRRQVINNLATHVLFTANKSSAIMSTHIVACLLLYRHRQGVVLSRLVEDFFNMKEEILSRDFDLGFSGNSEDVVMRALHLLEKCVNVTSSSNRNGEFTIAPAQTVPALFELNFYSNGLFFVFISDAIIACSILSLQRELLMESECGHPPKDPNCLPLSQERLIHKAAGLSQFLLNEVAVASPCQTIYQVFHDAVTRLIQYGVLYVAEEDQEELSSSPSDELWPKKFSEPLSWRSDEEDEDSDFGEEQRDRYLKVSVSAEHQEFFSFLQRLLSPVLEAYSGAAVFIHSLSQPMPESDYTQKLFRFLLTRTERGVAAYGESATHYLVKNTVKTFKELGVLKERRENKVAILELSSTFLPQANRNKLLQYILGFTLM
ncbi:glycerol-3-phosphate acyltransferase 1, mitochondrial isoform X2 [Austrofundulus limnaeus]|uniref:Glycerol-3-phosphate acyltransferase 1, mitochondrial n=1 Tax=Austrofundulus limnaeus TaxID=52670 RepID=A0A2I4B5S0_AUSLI|nr:PREDICTED: glycerol-3-phosphate acyltransferase 1, mitochondrial isoform X2 [Austrofundulus limnaeus]